LQFSSSLKSRFEIILASLDVDDASELDARVGDEEVMTACTTGRCDLGAGLLVTTLS
jgi:hypothetical protein